jgi:hypothetical protein
VVHRGVNHTITDNRNAHQLAGEWSGFKAAGHAIPGEPGEDIAPPEPGKD